MSTALHEQVHAATQSVQWSNATYVDLTLGQTYWYRDKPVRLLSMQSDYCTVEIDGDRRELIVARRTVPRVVGGLRVFVSDNRNVKGLTSDGDNHGFCRTDAVVCLSDPSQPLLDPNRFGFPVSRQDGYQWSMEEGSHMFAYLGLATYKGADYYRSHEGIDLDMHEARGKVLHPLVAVESGTILWYRDRAENGVVVVQRSDVESAIHYVYTHLNRDQLWVHEGQHLERGQPLGCIWGDAVWGHLHFAVTAPSQTPKPHTRYAQLLNTFPQLYELYHGDLKPRPRLWREGTWIFNEAKQFCNNKQRNYAYDQVVGYGWDLGKWCTANSVEPGVRLSKTIHRGTPAEATNPNDYFDFVVDVEPGMYRTRAKVGCHYESSWQQVLFNGVNAHVFHPSAGDFLWTPWREVEAPDGRLVMRVRLLDAKTYAGVKELHFRKQ